MSGLRGLLQIANPRRLGEVRRSSGRIRSMSVIRPSLVTAFLVVSACGGGSDGDADRSPNSAAESVRSPTSTAVAEAESVAETRAPVTADTTSSEPALPAVEPTASIPLGEHVDGGLVTDDAVWAVVTENEMLYRIDPHTNAVVQELAAPGIGYRFAIGHGAAWVSDFDASVVRRVDLDSGAVVAEIATGMHPEGVSVNNDAVWVANHHGGSVTRIDPNTNTAVATIEVGPAGEMGPQAIVASDERVWVGVPNLGQVVVIDAATNALVAKIKSPATCGEMSVLAESIWVTNCFETDDVAVIDQDGEEARGLKAGGPAGTSVLIDGEVWLATISLEDATGRFLRIDPATLEILDSVVADPPSYSIGQGFGSIWQFSWDAGAVIRLPIDPFVNPAG